MKHLTCASVLASRRTLPQLDMKQQSIHVAISRLGTDAWQVAAGVLLQRTMNLVRHENLELTKVSSANLELCIVRCSHQSACRCGTADEFGWQSWIKMTRTGRSLRWKKTSGVTGSPRAELNFLNPLFHMFRPCQRARLHGRVTPE